MCAGDRISRHPLVKTPPGRGDHLQQERAGAHGRIQYPHKRWTRTGRFASIRATSRCLEIVPRRVVGNAVAQRELVVEQIVNAAHHKRDQGVRRVEYTLPPPRLAVVCLQEWLVEIDRGVQGPSCIGHCSSNRLNLFGAEKPSDLVRGTDHGGRVVA